MTGPTRRQILLIIAALLTAALVVYSFLPAPVPVRTARAEYAPLRETVEEEGETRVDQQYVISSPVAAFIRRIELDAGDPVRRGQPLGQLEAPRASILDVRARDEASARVAAAEASLEQAREQARSAQASAELADADLKRIQALFESGAVARRDLDQARADASQADANLEAARARVETARAELAATRATLKSAAKGDAGQPVQQVLLSPVTGWVLAVHRRSEGFVNPGEPILEVGDIRRRQVWTDVLSQDAVRIRTGTRVSIDGWGGDVPLEAVVSRVEPLGVTEVSALGVEEQRVQIVADFVSPPEMWSGLGTGYRVLSRFVIWEAERVLQIPTGALFRTQDGWSVFTVEQGRAHRKPVTVGRRAGLAAQVLSGLSEGEVVIVHPDTAVEEGVRVEARPE